MFKKERLEEEEYQLPENRPINKSFSNKKSYEDNEDEYEDDIYEDEYEEEEKVEKKPIPQKKPIPRKEEKNKDFYNIISAEALEDGNYRYIFISNKPLKVGLREEWI